MRRRLSLRAYMNKASAPELLLQLGCTMVLVPLPNCIARLRQATLRGAAHFREQGKTVVVKAAR